MKILKILKTNQIFRKNRFLVRGECLFKDNYLIYQNKVNFSSMNNKNDRFNENIENPCEKNENPVNL